MGRHDGVQRRQELLALCRLGLGVVAGGDPARAELGPVRAADRLLAGRKGATNKYGRKPEGNQNGLLEHGSLLVVEVSDGLT
ncbi:hypothetical protein D3C86_1306730 [compost metagenome]